MAAATPEGLFQRGQMCEFYLKVSWKGLWSWGQVRVGSCVWWGLFCAVLGRAEAHQDMGGVGDLEEPGSRSAHWEAMLGRICTAVPWTGPHPTHTYNPVAAKEGRSGSRAGFSV